MLLLNRRSYLSAIIAFAFVLQILAPSQLVARTQVSDESQKVTRARLKTFVEAPQSGNKPKVRSRNSVPNQRSIPAKVNWQPIVRNVRRTSELRSSSVRTASIRRPAVRRPVADNPLRTVGNTRISPRLPETRVKARPLAQRRAPTRPEVSSTVLRRKPPIRKPILDISSPRTKQNQVFTRLVLAVLSNETHHRFSEVAPIAVRKEQKVAENPQPSAVVRHQLPVVQSTPLQTLKTLLSRARIPDFILRRPPALHRPFVNPFKPLDNAQKIPLQIGSPARGKPIEGGTLFQSSQSAPTAVQRESVGIPSAPPQKQSSAPVGQLLSVQPIALPSAPSPAASPRKSVEGENLATSLPKQPAPPVVPQLLQLSAIAPIMAPTIAVSPRKSVEGENLATSLPKQPVPPSVSQLLQPSAIVPILAPTIAVSQKRSVNGEGLETSLPKQPAPPVAPQIAPATSPGISIGGGESPKPNYRRIPIPTPQQLESMVGYFGPTLSINERRWDLNWINPHLPTLPTLKPKLGNSTIGLDNRGVLTIGYEVNGYNIPGIQGRGNDFSLSLHDNSLVGQAMYYDQERGEVVVGEQNSLQGINYMFDRWVKGQWKDSITFTPNDLERDGRGKEAHLKGLSEHQKKVAKTLVSDVDFSPEIARLIAGFTPRNISIPTREQLQTGVHYTGYHYGGGEHPIEIYWGRFLFDFRKLSSLDVIALTPNPSGKIPEGTPFPYPIRVRDIFVGVSEDDDIILGFRLDFPRENEMRFFADYKCEYMRFRLGKKNEWRYDSATRQLIECPEGAGDSLPGIRWCYSRNQFELGEWVIDPASTTKHFFPRPH